MKSVFVTEAPCRMVCRGVGCPGAGASIMLPQVLTDMTRMSSAEAAKVPELWAKVGGGRSSVAGSGLHSGPIVSSSVGEEAGSPRPAAWGGRAAVAAAVSPWAEGDEVRSPVAGWPAEAWAPSGVPSEGEGVVTEDPTPGAEVVLIPPAGSGATNRGEMPRRGPQFRRRGAGAFAGTWPP